MAERMRVLLDAYWWVGGPPSGRNVVRSLVRSWARRHPEDHLALALKGADRAQVAADLAELGIDAELRATPGYARVHAIAAWGAGRTAEGFDAVLTHNFATTGPTVSSVFVHDAMYVDHPEWFTRTERLYLSPLRRSLRRADIVFTSSRAEERRIARVWPETSDRVQAVGLHAPLDLVETAPHRPASAPEGPFVLTVGRLNVRKNLGRLVRAFTASRASAGRRLVIVGRPDGLGEVLPAGDDRVVVLSDVDDAGLAWLYANAELFVFPSLDEGFGLPLVEAASFGARSIASDIPVFRELALAEDHFDPRDDAAIARTLENALATPPAAAPGVVDEWGDTVDAMRESLLRRIRARGGARGVVAA